MKTVRWVIFSVIILFLLTCAAAVWFYTANPGYIFKALTDSLHDTYALDIKASKVGFDLLHGVDISGVTLSSASGKLYFRKGSILYNPIALFNKKIDILGIKVTGLETSADMIENLYSIFSKKSSRAGAAAFSIAVRRLEIEDSTVIYNDIPFSIYLSISPDRPLDRMPLSISIKSDSGRLVFKGSTSSGRIKVSHADIDTLFKTKSSIVIDDLDASVFRDRSGLLSCDCQTLGMYYNKMLFKSGGPFKFNFNLKDKILSANNIPAVMSESTAMISNLSYDFTEKRLEINAESSSIDIGDFLPRAGGHISGPFSLISHDGLILSGDFKVSALDYDFIRNCEGTVSVVSNALKAEVFALTPAGKAAAVIETGDIFNLGIAIQVKSDEFDIEKVISSLGEAPGQVPASKPLFKIYPVDFNFEIKNIIYKKFSITDATIAGEAQPGRLTVKELRAQFFRGTLSSDFVISGGSLSGGIKLDDCRLKDFSNLFLEDGKRLYGIFSLNGNFNVPLRDIKLSSGTFEAAIANGEVRDFFLQEAIAQTLYDIPMNDIFFDSIHAKGKLEDGKIIIEESGFESKDINASAHGTASLSDYTLDFSGNIRFLSSYLADLPNVTRIFTAGHESGGWVNFDVKAGGTFTKPAVSIE